MLFGIVIAVHIAVCLMLVLLVLVQSDKGGGLAGSIGGMGGGMNTVFGGRGTANVLTKATTWFAVGFMVVCLALNLIVAHGSSKQVKTTLQKRAERMQKTAPASILPGGVADPSMAGPPPSAPAPAPGSAPAPTPAPVPAEPAGAAGQ